MLAPVRMMFVHGLVAVQGNGSVPAVAAAADFARNLADAKELWGSSGSGVNSRSVFCSCVSVSD